MEVSENMETDVNVPKEQALQSKIKTILMKYKKLIILVASLVILGTIIGVVLSEHSPERIAEKYADAYLYDDIYIENRYSAYIKLVIPSDYADEEAYFEAQSDRYEEDIGSWKELGQVRRNHWKEHREEQYGAYKTTYEATRTEDISLRFLESNYEYYLDMCDEDGRIDRDNISEAKIITVKYKYKGEYDTYRDTVDVTLVKVGLLWKVLHCV